MPDFKFDLKTRFGAAFGQGIGRIAESALGFNYRVTPNPGNTSIDKPSAFSLPTAVEGDDVEYFSQLGTPIFDRIVFTVPGINGAGSNDYQLTLPPLIDLKNAKRISVTPINDNDFDPDNLTGEEVIESWGNSSWEITFRGILVDMVSHKRPLDQVKDLVEVFKKNSIIQVSTSRLFNAVGIRSIFITHIDLPAMEGFLDTQPYIIQARSYVAAELILN
jgi:hypothetical protein